MKAATLKFAGRQEGFGRIPSIDLYNVVQLSEASEVLRVEPGTAATVTIGQVEKAGYVPIIEQ